MWNTKINDLWCFVLSSKHRPSRPARHALRTAATGLLRTAGWWGGGSSLAPPGPRGLLNATATRRGQIQAVVTKQVSFRRQEIQGPSYTVRVQDHQHRSHCEQQTLLVRKTSWEYNGFIKKVISQYVILAQYIGRAHSYRGEVSIRRHKLSWKIMSMSMQNPPIKLRDYLICLRMFHFLPKWSFPPLSLQQ